MKDTYKKVKENGNLEPCNHLALRVEPQKNAINGGLVS